MLTDKQELGRRVVAVLTARYPDACSLDDARGPDFQPWKLLFAVRLAAQCTDARVNLVTPVLYARFPTLEALAGADVREVQEIVRPCGLYQTKGRDLVAAANRLLDTYGGAVPDSLDALLSLPGIGRKTANLILSDVFGHPAVVADTHCIRIANRLGLVDVGKDPYKVELALSQVIEPAEQAPLCHRFVHFGRDICLARGPKCGLCPLVDLCADYQKRQAAEA
jgi:endonuclease-3